MSTSVTWNGVNYSIPAASEVGWSALADFLIALGTDAAIAQEMKQAVRVATTTPVTVSDTTDCVVATKLAAPGAVAVNLPAGTNGRWFVIVDQLGDAATNNITITPNGAETINGSATFVMNQNNEGVVLVYSTTNTRWNVVGRFTSGAPLTNPMDSAGDMIYGGTGGTATKLDNGSSGQLLMANGAAAPSWTDTITGLKTFQGGISSAEYVGTNPEVGGSTPFQLTVAHKRIQTINPAGTITVKMPTTSVKAGEVFRINNRSANQVVIQSSGANQIDIIYTGYAILVALIDTPTAAGDWHVADVCETVTWTAHFTGPVASFDKTGYYARQNKLVNLGIPDTSNQTGNNSGVAFTITGMPSHITTSPATQIVGQTIVTNSSADVSGAFKYTTGGALNVYVGALGNFTATNVNNHRVYGFSMGYVLA